MITYRIVKRVTAVTQKLADFLEAEFETDGGKPDLQVSVYRCTESDVPRMHAEHAVTTIYPPRAFHRFNTAETGVGRLEKRPIEKTPFSFVREAHYEHNFDDPEELTCFAEELRRRGLTTSKMCCIGRYVVANLGTDEEWIAAEVDPSCKLSQTASSWKKRAHKWAAACSCESPSAVRPAAKPVTQDTPQDQQ